MTYCPGVIKEVSMEDVLSRPAPEPVNWQVTKNRDFLAGLYKAAYAPPVKDHA